MRYETQHATGFSRVEGISDVPWETDVPALNANTEASRDGASGIAFAVVPDESTDLVKQFEDQLDRVEMISGGRGQQVAEISREARGVERAIQTLTD